MNKTLETTKTAVTDIKNVTVDGVKGTVDATKEVVEKVRELSSSLLGTTPPVYIVAALVDIFGIYDTKVIEYTLQTFEKFGFDSQKAFFVVGGLVAFWVHNRFFKK